MGSAVTGLLAQDPIGLSPAPAAAAVRSAAVRPLPQGWSLTRDGTAVAWRSPHPLPVLDARTDIQVDGRTLPARTTTADGRTVVADLDGRPVRDPGTLKVLAAGRRLDRSLQPPPTAGDPVPTPSPREPLPALPGQDDPGNPGGHRTVRGEYTLDPLRIDGLAEPVEMQGLVIAPADLPGPRPLAIFLHGRHMSCFDPADPDDASAYLAWPCPEGWRPLPSHRGYAQSQELLAGQGWITVSLGANGINAQDGLDDGGAAARSALVRAHLRQWADWTASDTAWAQAPEAVRAGARPDLRRVLLIGHSRGGEGVNRAALDSATDPSTPWRIRGQLLIAPTAFGRNPAPGTPTVVLLPGCDGDVYDLQGQYYLDDARDVTADPVLRSALFVEGANHNYFNSEWTPGRAEGPAADDWYTPDDPMCGPGTGPRLSADVQRNLGAVYTAAAAQVLVEERAPVAPLLDGTPVRAASAGDTRVLAHAIGGTHEQLLVPSPRTPVTAGEGTAVRRCATTRSPESAEACAPKDAFGMTPSFGAHTGAPDEPTRTALELTWKAPGGTASIGLPGAEEPSPEESPTPSNTPQNPAPDPTDEPTDDATDLTLRAILPAADRGTRFTVSVRDRDGDRADLGTATMNGVPAGLPTVGHFLPSEKYWAQEVRLPLDRQALALAGVDLARLSRIEVTPLTGSGRLWLLDVWTYRPGMRTPSETNLPRFDLGSLSLVEGNLERTVELPVTVSGTVRQESTAWFVARGRNGAFLPLGSVAVAPGQTGFTLKIPVEGNLRDDPDTVTYSVQGVGTRGIVGGNVVGAIRVTDDDPAPPLSVMTSAAAVEGQSLAWKFTLAEASGINLYLPVAFAEPVDGSTELSTGDLSTSWWQDRGHPDLPDVPLSRSGVTLFVFLPAGETSVSLVVPVARDDLTEGRETLRGLIPGDTPPGVQTWEGTVRGLPDGATLLGTVTDGPAPDTPTASPTASATG
ncbi:MAG: hypothetical protein QG608_2311 [Actinomycetota bacterium]|nr:hypothetical protein [Actinomycetota bacterium]